MAVMSFAVNMPSASFMVTYLLRQMTAKLSDGFSQMTAQPCDNEAHMREVA